MSCRGMGICGCGAERCVGNAWWSAWIRCWNSIGHVVVSEAIESQRMVDDSIDFEREQNAH